jgi:hypothetical protein
MESGNKPQPSREIRGKSIIRLSLVCSISRTLIKVLFVATGNNINSSDSAKRGFGRGGGVARMPSGRARLCVWTGGSPDA